MLLEIDTLTFVLFYKFDFFLKAQSVFTAFYVAYSTFFSSFSEFNVVTSIVIPEPAFPSLYKGTEKIFSSFQIGGAGNTENLKNFYKLMNVLFVKSSGYTYWLESPA